MIMNPEEKSRARIWDTVKETEKEEEKEEKCGIRSSQDSGNSIWPFRRPSISRTDPRELVDKFAVRNPLTGVISLRLGGIKPWLTRGRGAGQKRRRHDRSGRTKK
jgi:hypothetical protein